MAKTQTRETITVTVEPEELKRFEDRAFESLRRDLELPGFRKGNVSVNVAQKAIPKETVFKEAVELAVAEKGTDAIKDVLDRIVGQPDVKVTKAAPGNPLEFSVTVDMLPEIDVSDWRQMRIPINVKAVTDEDVDAALEKLRASRIRSAAVNRAAKEGDMVEIDFETRIKGVKIEGGEGRNHPIVIGENNFVPGFDKEIEGLEKDSEKTFTLPFPSDWPNKQIAGSDGEFSVKVRAVKERILPEADDTFAKSLGGFEDMDGLRKSITEGLDMEREQEARQKVRMDAVKKLGDKIKEHHIPEIVIEQEMGRIKEEMRMRVEQYGMQFDEYLKQLGKDENDLSKDWRDGAVDRVRATLIIRAVASQEGIEAGEEEVKKRVEDIVEAQNNMGKLGDRKSVV